MSIKLPESTASPRKIKAKERQIEALALRKEGFTYAEIAKNLRYASESGARKAVKQAMAALDKVIEVEAGEVRTLELTRYDGIIKAFWPGVIRADEKAAVVVMKAMEGRRELLGVDAPEKFVFELSPEAVRLLEKMGLSTGQVAAEFEALVRQAAENAGIREA